ncbi:MAG: DNA primase [Parcubacteria group bacterium]
MSENIDEIKHKLDIVSVVQDYVQLKKTGASWKARCPFHNEKTPSFHVNPDRQIWHCFGCNEGGDMFTFVEKIENVEFAEALKILAKKAGVELKQFDAKTAGRKTRLQEICKLAAGHWQDCLNGQNGKIARDYVEKRGLSKETLESFKIGYALDSWDDLLKFLLNKKFNETEIFQAGLVVKKDKGTGYYDRFRGRVTFPIQDIHGNVIGFSARALKEGEPAKYINTPEGELYHKGKVLFGLDKAKMAIREQNYAVVVEGNLDVIACHQAGFKNTVACSGTALTADQIGIIKRYTENIALCFDQDSAGQLAAQRSIDLLYAAEMNVKIVQIVFGKDPDECIKNNPADWVLSLKQAKLAMQFYFDKYLTGEYLGSISKKKQAAKILLAEILKIKNRIEQDHWLKQLAERLNVSEQILRESLPATKAGPRVQKSDSAPPAPAKSREKECLERIFAIILNHPERAAYASEYLSPEAIRDEDLRALYTEIILCYNKTKANISPKALQECLAEDAGSEKNKGYLDSLIVYIDEIYPEFSVAQIDQELISLINIIRTKDLDRRIAGKMAEVNNAARKDAKDKLTKDIQSLIEQKAGLN